MKKMFVNVPPQAAFASLKYDFVFREVFSRESILRYFISDVTGIPLARIKSVRVINPFLWKRYRKQKQGILDVALLLNDDRRIDIELQLRRQRYWMKRNLFYLAKMYTEDLKMGESYEKLRRCISISILDFALIPGEQNHTVYSLRDKNGNEFTDLFEIHIIELNKKIKDNSAISEWIRLFNAGAREDLDNIDTQNVGVREAMEVVRTMNLVKRLRWMYEEHLKLVRDRWAEDEYVRDEGRAEGRAESVLTLLSRFDDVPDDVKDQIMRQSDPTVLDEWLLIAAEVENIQEFRERIC